MVTGRKQHTDKEPGTQARFIEYDTPKYSSSDRDWRAYNTAFLRAWNR